MKSFFLKCLKEFNLFFIWTFFDMTQRTYLLFFLKIDFFEKYDSQNWTYFCLNTTQWIDPIFLNVTQLKFWLKNVKKLNFFWLKIELFFTWLEELNLFFSIWLKELFSNLDSKNWTFHYLTQRVELFSYLTQCIELFSCLPQRILWVTLENKKGSILWVIFLDQMFQFFASHERKRCSFLCVIFKEKGSILCVVLKEKGCNSLRIWKKGLKSLTHIKKFNSLSHTKKTPILWLILNKKSSILRAIFEEKFNSLSLKKISSPSQKGFNSLSQKERLQLFESSWKEVHKKRFNSMSQVIFLEKSSIQRVIQKRFNSLSHIREKSWILWVVLENFNSLSRIKKKINVEKKKSCSKKQVQFCESYWKKKSVLWVVFVFQKKKNIFESHNEKGDQFFESFFVGENILKRRFTSVSHKKSNSLSFFWWKKKQVFESCFSRRVEFFESYWKNSLSHIEKKFSSLYRIFGESSILWVVFFFFSQTQKSNSLTHAQKKFNSSSHVKEGSIQWVVFKQKWVGFFESYSKKRKVPRSKKKKFFELHSKKVQFFESVKKTTQIEKRFIKEAQFYESFTKSSILWVIFLKEDFVFLSLFFWHKVQFFESYSWKKKRFNSVSHYKKQVQLFESFFQNSFLWVTSEKKFNSLSQ